MPSFSYEKSIISSPRPSAMPRCGGSPCALLTRKRIIFSFRSSLAKGMFTGISMVLNSLSNVKGHPRRADAQIDQTPSTASDAPPCSDSSSSVVATSEGYSASADKPESAPPPLPPAWPPAQLPEHEHEWPQPVAPHPSVHVTKSEIENCPLCQCITPPTALASSDQ